MEMNNAQEASTAVPLSGLEISTSTSPRAWLRQRQTESCAHRSDLFRERQQHPLVGGSSSRPVIGAANQRRRGPGAECERPDWWCRVPAAPR